MRGPALSMSVVVCLAVSGTPATAAPADDGDAAIEAARDAAAQELTRARDRVDARRAELRARGDRVDAARRSGGAADGEVRRAEAPLPSRVLDVRAAAADLEAAIAEVAATRRAVRQLTATRDRLEGELEVARDILGERARRTFKVGQLAELSGPVAVIREARHPGELAHDLGQLRGLTRDGAADVRGLTAALDEVALQLRAARAARDAAEAERTAAQLAVADAEAAAASAEDAAAAARRRAASAEASVVAALEEELAARGRVQDAVDELLAAVAAAARAEVTAERLLAARDRAEQAREQAAVDDDRPDEVAGRRRAHQRQVALAAEHRRVAATWGCPVAAGRFVNDWSFPRSGDRRHEGTDVFAPRGTPVTALAAGTVTAVQRIDRSGSLGGRSVSVTDGEHRHYYAHLDVVAPDLREGDRVAAGDVLGTVGTTGNARGTPPHLHLGWYVRDTAVNPYASLVVACHPADDAAAPDDEPLGRPLGGEARR